MDKKFTHKGWFGICPIYAAGVYTDCPVIQERHIVLFPLMAVMMGVFVAANTVLDVLFSRVLGFPIFLTGELQ